MVAKRHIEVQAHRGANRMALENTLSAFSKAMDIGVNSIEMDLHLSADGVPVVFHDFDITEEKAEWKSEALKPLPQKITSLTARELSLLQLKSPRGLESLPTLAEVFELAKSRSVSAFGYAAIKQLGRGVAEGGDGAPFCLDLELKRESGGEVGEFVKKVVECVRAYPEISVRLRSFDRGLLKAAFLAVPDLERVVLFEKEETDWQLGQVESGAAIVAPNFMGVTKALVDWAHGRNLRVIPYTVNLPEDWQAMLDLGVDGLTTDDPAGLVQFLTSSSS